MVRPNLDEFRGEVNLKLDNFQKRQDKLRAVGLKEVLVRANEKHEQWLDHHQVSTFKKLINEPCEISR